MNEQYKAELNDIGAGLEPRGALSKKRRKEEDDKEDAMRVTRQLIKDSIDDRKLNAEDDDIMFSGRQAKFNAKGQASRLQCQVEQYKKVPG